MESYDFDPRDGNKLLKKLDGRFNVPNKIEMTLSQYKKHLSLTFWQHLIYHFYFRTLNKILN